MIETDGERERERERERELGKSVQAARDEDDDYDIYTYKYNITIKQIYLKELFMKKKIFINKNIRILLSLIEHNKTGVIHTENKMCFSIFLY